MSADDEKALSWEGETDPSHVAGPVAVTKKADAAPATAHPSPASEKTGPGSFLLVSYGILGGAYLIYTVGWLVSVFGDERSAYPEVLSEIMYQLGEFLAIASPAVWFFVIFVLTRKSKPILRLLGLLLGLLVVIPWPFVLLGA